MFCDGLAEARAFTSGETLASNNRTRGFPPLHVSGEALEQKIAIEAPIPAPSIRERTQVEKRRAAYLIDHCLGVAVSCLGTKALSLF